MVNEKLIRLIMEQIEATPEHWDQADWENLTIGQRIRRMKETIFDATGVDIP